MNRKVRITDQEYSTIQDNKLFEANFTCFFFKYEAHWVCNKCSILVLFLTHLSRRKYRLHPKWSV